MRTSAELTAAIFGLSTLISSYQIYNLNKQVWITAFATLLCVCLCVSSVSCASLRRHDCCVLCLLRAPCAVVQPSRSMMFAVIHEVRRFKRTSCSSSTTSLSSRWSL